MPLQYTDQEIDEFVQTLQQYARRNLAQSKRIVPMGFALGRVDPMGVRQRSAHVIYYNAIRTLTKLKTLSAHVQRMALRAEAECAGCVVNMPAIIQEEGDKHGDVHEIVMIHAEQLLGRHRLWHARVQSTNGELELSDFTELSIWPHPDHLSFLPIEIYGKVTAQA